MNIVDEKDKKERIFHHGILKIHNMYKYKSNERKKKIFSFDISFQDDIVNYNNIIVTLSTIYCDLWKVYIAA